MERVVQMLCSIARDRLDSRVLGFNRGRSTVEDVVDGVPVTRVGTLGEAGSVPIAPTFAAHLRRATADVMIVHEPNPWALVSLIAARPVIPSVVWFHSEVVRPWLQYRLFYAPVAAPVYRRARRFVVSSPALGDQSSALRPYHDRITVIPFGIDADAWRMTPPLAPRVAELRGAAGRPSVLFVGRLVSYKGVDVLIKAVATLSVRLTIVGEGPMRATWERLAAGHRGPALIEFTGPLPDDEVKARLHATDVFVLPSVTPAEAFGFVQLEAMACATPVISTRLASGVPWVNRDGETGLVVPPGDVAALRAAITTLVDDQSLRARLGAGGLARARSDFSVKTMADGLVQLCERVAEPR
jgi:glycosyltransferase involved in cell wall biosynthesis